MEKGPESVLERERTSDGNTGVSLLGNSWAITIVLCLLVIPIVGVTVMLQRHRDHGTASSYLGPNRCAECHPDEHKAWSETRMARSFDVLKPGQAATEKETAGLDPTKDYTHDEGCLPCHTTGYGAVGGFRSVAETPELVGVTCESCHGPGGSYVDAVMEADRPSFALDEARDKGLHYPPTADVCRTCHNRQSPYVKGDYRFDYDERVGRGTHRHFRLIYDEVKARRRKGRDGG